jgi:PAS domain S-box-containing protein
VNSIDIDKWIEKHMFHIIPMSAAVIDRDFNLIQANKAFEEMFGKWENQKCYKVYKNRDSLCHSCKGSRAFKDGEPKITPEVGYDKSGKLTKYIKHTIPIKNEIGEVDFLIEIAVDVTEAEQIKHENQLLFEQVPCDIFIFDKDYKIVRTNKKSQEMFGNIEGQHCYSILKNRKTPCTDCSAKKSFIDGKRYDGRSTVIDKNGKTVEFHVTTVPLKTDSGESDLVLEMAVDITNTIKLQDELKLANTFMSTLISSSQYGVVAVNKKEEVTIFNKAAKKIFNVKDEDQVTCDILKQMLPNRFLHEISVLDHPIYLPEVDVTDINGEIFPVRLMGKQLMIEDNYMGKAFWVNDLREIKKLESEKLEAERLAVVGQTVAGLAHGIKNVLTGLEGGIYLLNSGLAKGDIERSQKGMEMINRNTSRVSTFVKEFLSFSKGHKIKTTLCNPSAMAQEVLETFSVEVNKLGIQLVNEFDKTIAPARFDSESIIECLSNLFGNAIDACRISENKADIQIRFSVFEKDNCIYFRIRDNGCGMDYEIKKKIFTTFFTTKGLGGTGLGLLMTKKIVQQHGGKVDFISEPNLGTTFEIVFPRDRLPELSDIN